VRKGFSKYPFMMDEEREYILKAIERGRTDAEIATKISWPIKEVAETRAEFFPTAGLAKYYLKSQALKLAQRIVAEANVEEAVDILSRPNIGVLAPAVKNAPGPMKAQFLTSINPGDLGGVKVAAQITTGEVIEEQPVESAVEPELVVPLSAVQRLEAAVCSRQPATSPPAARKARTRRSQAPPSTTPPSPATPIQGALSLTTKSTASS
jgi:hypothetical protein